MSITLTPSARSRVRQFSAVAPVTALELVPVAASSTPSLRFGVRKTGCSGFAYIVEMSAEIHDGDTVFDSEGVQVIVDAASLAVVDGTEIDFQRQGLNSNFVFNNPKVTGACGCGESFSIEREAI